MGEKRELDQSSPLFPVLNEIGKPKPNYLTMATALVEASKQIIHGYGFEAEADRLLQTWKSLTQNGNNIEGVDERDATTAYFQRDLDKIAALTADGDSTYIFYVPGGGGYIRLGFKIDENGQPDVWLADSGSNQQVEKQFDLIKP